MCTNNKKNNTEDGSDGNPSFEELIVVSSLSKDTLWSESDDCDVSNRAWMIDMSFSSYDSCVTGSYSTFEPSFGDNYCVHIASYTDSYIYLSRRFDTSVSHEAVSISFVIWSFGKWTTGSDYLQIYIDDVGYDSFNRDTDGSSCNLQTDGWQTDCSKLDSEWSTTYATCLQS